MSRLIKTFPDGSILEFDDGRFDSWCVYLTRPNELKNPPLDIQYFSRLKELGTIYGNLIIYEDFVSFYNMTNTLISNDVLNHIDFISNKYNLDSLEINILFTIIYAGMVAEENKLNAILKKRIKRLGMHQVLLDNETPYFAANFSKGKKWRDLDAIMKLKGF